MHIQCDVRACDPARPGYRHCAECLVVFIAVRDGAPTPVPAWRPASSLEIHESDEAVMRIGLRKDIERAMAQQVYSGAGTAPRSTLRLLAATSDVNWGGNAHGGRIISWIDDAANLCADGRPTPVARWSPVSAEDHALDAHARDLIRLRARGRSARRVSAPS